MSINFKPLGDSAIFITFGDEISEEIHLSIKKFMKILEDHPFNGFIEMVPSYTNICIYYDVYQVNQWKFEGSSPYEKVVNYVKTLLQKKKKLNLMKHLESLKFQYVTVIFMDRI
ncbi:hypothetical protein UACE39S_06043 [Ureibacillus acetophenoni]